MPHRSAATAFSSAIFLAGFLLTSPDAFAGPIIANASFEDVQIGPPFNSYCVNLAATTDPSCGFQNVVPGWTHTGDLGDDVLWHTGYSDGGGAATVAGDGNQFITLGIGLPVPRPGIGASPTWVSRDPITNANTITGLIPGQGYALHFLLAYEGPEVGALSQQLIVQFVDGATAPAETFIAPENNGNYWQVWLPQTYLFVATSTSAAIQFSTPDGQPQDIGIDALSISETPEPQTIALMLVAALSLLGIALRRGIWARRT